MARNSRSSPSAFVLEFVASLLFLGALAVAYGKGLTTGALVAGAGAVWVPILFGTATVGSIALLVASFANLSGSMACQRCSHSARLLAMVAAVSLFALVAVDMFSIGIVAIGLILAMVGTLASHSEPQAEEEPLMMETTTNTTSTSRRVQQPQQHGGKSKQAAKEDSEDSESEDED